jgi:hypothetical protein
MRSDNTQLGNKLSMNQHVSFGKEIVHSIEYFRRPSPNLVEVSVNNLPFDTLSESFISCYFPLLHSYMLRVFVLSVRALQKQSHLNFTGDLVSEESLYITSRFQTFLLIGEKL